MSNETRDCRVSVIIPSRNGLTRGFLSESIRSALKQSHTPAEIILVDDGSSDQTVDFIKANFPTVRIQSQEAKGLPAARNSGLQISTGEFVAFLDDDDIWLPSKLEKQVSFLRSSENEDMAAVGCDSYIINSNGLRVSNAECFVESIRWPYILALHPIWHGGSCLLLRKRALEKVGLFDESIQFAEDYDYWIRVSKNFEIGWIREFLIERRRHREQMSFNRQQVVENLTKVFNSHQSTLGEGMQTRYFDFFISFQSLYAIRCREFVFGIQLLTKVIFSNPIVWIFHILRPLRDRSALGRLNKRMIMWYLSESP